MTDTGAISTASRTRSAFFWRSSSSSRGSAPIRPTRAAPLAIRPTRRAGSSGNDEAVVSSVKSGGTPPPAAS